MSVNPAASPDELPAADVCVVIVAFRSAGALPRLLDSLDPAAPGLRLRVVVVENSPSDESSPIASSRGALVVAGHGNIGYAAAINVARPLVTGCAAILVANPDLRFEPGAIARLYSAAGGQRITVPRLVDESGALRLSQRREPTVRRQLGEALFGDRWPSRPAAWAALVRQPAAYASATDVDWATGAALLIPAQCLDDVGPWDETFFLYSEEVDYARRARASGWPIRFVPQATAIHAEGGSGRNEALDALEFVNKIRYAAKWHSRSYSLAYSAAVVLELLLRANRPGHRHAIRPVARAAVQVARGRSLPGARAIALGASHDADGGRPLR